jgi:hypothetical protein
MYRYALTCCSWFAKDFPRLLAAKAAHSWDPYDVEELRGKTLGVVGYGDIGRWGETLQDIFCWLFFVFYGSWMCWLMGWWGTATSAGGRIQDD